MTAPAQRIGIVVLTHNRREELLRTVDRLRALDGQPPICVVDNASQDGSVDAVARAHPAVRLIRLARNLGAAARNEGVRRMHVPYVAFSDDDTWWARGALGRAVELLDAHPRLAGGEPQRLRAFVAALAGLPWVLRQRRVLPPHVESDLRLLEANDHESR